MRLNVPQGLIVALNPAHHKSAFERGHDQCRHRLRVHSGTRVALGDRVAELGWSIESDLARRGNWWTDLGHRLGKQRLRGTVEDWFAWQTLVVDEGLNRVHVPARYAAVVAQEADVHDVLLDVGPCSSFYEEETGCYYLPPLTAHPYDRFHFALDEMELDLTPREMCFCR